jgi:hypothetical protein
MHSFKSISYVSPQPGTRLVVLGAVHGDEVCGTRAIERVVAELDAGTLTLVKGRVTFVPVTNPLAYAQKRRAGDRNLNRKLQPTTAPREYEDHVANWLCPLLADHEILGIDSRLRRGADSFLRAAAPGQRAGGGRSGQNDVHRARGADVARRLEAEPAQVDPGEERFAAAEHGRRDREVHLVDETGLEVLADDGDAAADADVAALRRRARLRQRAWMPPVTKWKVVPPSISSGARGWWVSTNTGTWYGGLAPHQPFHSSSGHGPRLGANMLRPRIQAPTLSKPLAAKSSSGPVVPLSLPNSMRWKVRVGNTQSCSASPPRPSGCSRLCAGPAPKPSIETLKLAP